MHTKIISSEDLRKIVNHVGLHRLMDEMIARLLLAFQNFDETKISVPKREGFQYDSPHPGLIEWMPAMQLGKQVTIKMVGYHPKNPLQHKLPTILSTVSLIDTTNGHLVGFADATFLTALRTGAASAIASKYLAHPESRVIGLIGAGAQAVTQLHALSRIFSIEKVKVYDINSSVSKDFLQHTAFIELETDIVSEPSLPQLVEESDILCTATSVGIGKGPVFDELTTKPWLHINAVGSDFPGKIEIPHSLLKRSFVCPDSKEQAMKEGEAQQLSPEEVGPELFELIQHSEQYHHVKQELSVFDSTGWAFEDLIAMDMLMDYASTLGLGTSIQLESTTDNPKNPYHFSLVGPNS